VIAFTVYGDPYPQGSMKRIGKNIIPDSPKMTRWRNLVIVAARAARGSHPRVTVKRKRKLGKRTVTIDRHVCYDEPIVVWVWFYFATPPKPRAGDRSGYIGSTYDTDKLFRAIGDALEAADVVSNDKRVAGWPVTPARQYCDEAHPRAEIIVASVSEALAANLLPVTTFAEVTGKLGGRQFDNANRDADGSPVRGRDGL